MAGEATLTLSKYLHQLSASARGEHLPDRTLVERFVAQRDEDAFATLVRRHGPMVLRVCQCVLRDSHDAEDVFQAVFLVLSRKAASLRRADSVGCFLHGVAYRLAQKARAQIVRQRKQEGRFGIAKQTEDPLAEVSVREARAILDEELARLPEKYRAPLVLCCLQGRTRDEAARHLGWSGKLLKTRLENGRKRLRDRLGRRGLTLPATLASAVLIEESAPAAVPAMLVRATVRAVQSGPTSIVSPSIDRLANSALRSAGMMKAKIAVGMLLLTSALVAGVGTFLPSRERERAVGSLAHARGSDSPRRDRFGDPLPPGAVARIGTVRFRDGDGILTLALSADGKRLASATGFRQSKIRLWDAISGKPLSLLDTKEGPVASLAFSPDGRMLASIAAGGKRGAAIQLWDVATRKPLRTFRDRGAGFASLVAFSPDGRHLAAGGWDHTIGLWDIPSGKERLRFRGHQGEVWSLAFSGDGKTLVTSSGDRTIRLWDAATSEELRLLPVNQPCYVAFSSDSRTIVGGDSTGAVHLWDAATGRKRLTIRGHEKWRHAGTFTRQGPAIVAFSPDGKSVAAGYEGVVYDSASGKERCQLQNYQRWVWSLVYSPDGRTLAGESNHRIRFWDAATGKEIFKDATHRDAVSSVVFSPDGRTLFTACRDDSLGVWEIATGRACFRFQGEKRSGYEWNRNRIAVSPDGRMAAVWLAGVLYSWSLPQPKILREGSDGAEEFDSQHGLGFSAQGRLLASAWSYKDKTLRLWNKGMTKTPLILRNRGGFPNDLAFSSEGKSLAAAWSDGSAAWWEVATGKQILTPLGVKGHPGPKGLRSSAAASSLAFSPDGRTLVVGGSDGTIGLWDRDGGSEQARVVFSFPENLVQAIAFSPDGRTVAAGYEDGAIRMWEIAAGKIRRHWATQTGSILSLAYSSDGRLLASAGSDTTVLIWKADAEIQPEELTAEKLAARWADLANEDAAQAYRAIAALRAASQQSVPFLKAHLRPVPAIDATLLTHLIADLDDERFRMREKATAELVKFGDRAEGALRKTLNGRPSLEVRRRIEAILAKLHGPLSAEQLREVRSVEALEGMATWQARELLRTLAAGAPSARLTREAKAALARLKPRR